MSPFESDLQARLDAVRAAGLWRELRRLDSPQGVRVRVAGRELINFSSNDYLGLAHHPALREAAKKALDEFGAGSGASRLICGSLAPHHELEEELSAWKGTEAALTFSTGYAAALGAITALLEKDDIIVVDRLVHASIVDAARLSRAKLRAFAHNDLNDLEDKLKWAAQHIQHPIPNLHRRTQVLIVTESIFSMDGDVAPLREIVELKDRYRAWLMVDEAHATGLFGVQRSGLIEQFGLNGRVEIQMATLGKALGSAGGAICGSRRLVDFLVNRARSFIFSTGPAPAAAAAARAAIELVKSADGEARCRALWERVLLVAADVRRLSNPLQVEHGSQSLLRPAATQAELPSAILPLVVGEEAKAVGLSDALKERGFLVPAIRFPTVARGTARLRVTLSAAHSRDDVAAFADAVNTLINR